MTGTSIDYRRLVQRVTRPSTPEGYDQEVLGGQHDWVWAVGMPYRTLAAPFSGAVMPEDPQKLVVRNEFGHSEGNFWHGLGYFAALQSFLTYSFGWSRHDKGLIWWYDHGWPVDDERFALIRDIWLHDGLLERYLAWSIEHPDVVPLTRFANGVDSRPIALAGEWDRNLRDVRADAEEADLSTLPDGMHLNGGEHIGWPSRVVAGSAARLTGVDRERRTAILLCERVAGWYADLARLGAGLAPSQSRSWRIEVYVKPIGFLGSYRRSRQTGLWFSGRHSYHAAGN